jgi:hypothetical protein
MGVDRRFEIRKSVLARIHTKKLTIGLFKVLRNRMYTPTLCFGMPMEKTATLASDTTGVAHSAVDIFPV